MNDETQEISGIQFGILSESEILQMSVVEVTKNKLCTGKTKGLLSNTLYDSRMGPMESGEICPTCDLKTKDCPGHFGHINLNIKIIHPLFHRIILHFLKCFCIQCSKLLITRDHLELWNFMRLKGEHRFNQILTKVSKIRYCTQCTLSQPKYTLMIQEGIFIAAFKLLNDVEKIKLSTEEIYKIFHKISNEDVGLLGFDPEKTHPKNLILTVLPVLPPRSRPFIITDNIICDDDLTISYSEIIKANNNLNNNTINETKREKCIQTLIFRIKTLMDNSSQKAKHTNSRPIKGIKERICGKNGLIRSNLLGKRTDMSARTVIGPDPTLRLNQIAIPTKMATDLSYPETVNQWNIELLQRLVFEGKTNMINRTGKNGKTQRIYTELALNSSDRTILCTLKIGDVVHRHLKDGDVVLINRQPTLHKGSMLAKHIVVRPGKSIRLNLATTSTFNAD